MTREQVLNLALLYESNGATELFVIVRLEMKHTFGRAYFVLCCRASEAKYLRDHTRKDRLIDVYATEGPAYAECERLNHGRVR